MTFSSNTNNDAVACPGVGGRTADTCPPPFSPRRIFVPLRPSHQLHLDLFDTYFQTVFFVCLFVSHFSYVSNIHTKMLISNTLFAMFVNDLAQSIKTANCGIPIRNERCRILMYADDVVLLAESPDQLQQCLDILHTWTRHWRHTVNTSKTKVM